MSDVRIYLGNDKNVNNTTGRPLDAGCELYFCANCAGAVGNIFVCADKDNAEVRLMETQIFAEICPKLSYSLE